MKISSLCLSLMAAMILALSDYGVSAQSVQPKKPTSNRSEDGQTSGELRSSVLRSLLSSPLEFHNIIQREEADLLKSQLQKRPNDAKLLLKTADALVIASQFGMVDEQMWLDARKLLVKSIGHDPNNIRALFSLANWYLNELMFTEARQCIDKAKLLGGKNEDVAAAFADIDDWESRVKSGRMRPIPMRKLIKPDAKPLHVRRPIDELALSDESKSLLQRIEINQNDAKSWQGLGRSLIQDKSQPTASMKAAAYQCLIRAKTLDPKDIEAREMLIELYQKNGVPELMKQECLRLLEVQPNHMRARYLLGNDR